MLNQTHHNDSVEIHTELKHIRRGQCRNIICWTETHHNGQDSVEICAKKRIAWKYTLNWNTLWWQDSVQIHTKCLVSGSWDYSVRQAQLASVLSAVVLHCWNEDITDDKGSGFGLDDLQISWRVLCSASQLQSIIKQKDGILPSDI